MIKNKRLALIKSHQQEAQVVFEVQPKVHDLNLMKKCFMRDEPRMKARSKTWHDAHRNNI